MARLDPVRRIGNITASACLLLLVVALALGALMPPPAKADGLDPFCDAPSTVPSTTPPTLTEGRFAGARIAVRGVDGSGRSADATFPPRLGLPDLLTGGSSHPFASRLNWSIAGGEPADFSFGYGLRTSTASSPSAAGELTGENPLHPLFLQNFGLPANTAIRRDEVGGVGLSLFVHHPATARRHDISGEFTVDVTMDEGGSAHHYRVTVGIDARPAVVGAGAVFPTASRISLLFKKNTSVGSPGSRPERGWWGVAEELSYQDYPGITDATRPPVKVSVDVTEIAGAVTTPTLQSTQAWSKAPLDFAVGISDECTPAARGTDAQTSRLTWVRPSGPSDATVRVTARSGIGRGVRGLDGMNFDATATGVPRTMDVRFRQRHVSIDRSPDVTPRLRLDTLQSAALPPAGSPPEEPTIVSGEIGGLPEHTVAVASNTALDRLEVITCPSTDDLARLRADYGLGVTAPECTPGSPHAAGEARVVMQNWAPAEAVAPGPVHDAVAELPAVPPRGQHYVLVASRERRGDDPASVPALSITGADLEHVRRVVVDRGGAPSGGRRVLGIVETDGPAASPNPALLLLRLDGRTSNDPARNTETLVAVDGRLTSVPNYAKFEAVTDPRGGTPFRARWDGSAEVHAEANVDYVGPRAGGDDVDQVTGRFVTGPDGDLSRRVEVAYRDGAAGAELAVDGDAQMRLRGRALLTSPNERAASEPTGRLVRAATKSDHLSMRWRAGRDGLALVHGETCTGCDTSAGAPVSLVYAAGVLTRILPPVPAGTDPVDAVPAQLHVPDSLTSGPNPAFLPLAELGPDDAGARVVEVPGKLGVETDYRANVYGLKRVDFERLGAGEEARSRFCTDAADRDGAFRVGLFRWDGTAGGDPGSATAVDARLDRVPARIAAELKHEPFVTRTWAGRPLLALRADPAVYAADGTCAPEAVAASDRPDDPAGRPEVVFDARSARLDPVGAWLLRDAAPPRPHDARGSTGADVQLVLGPGTDVVDVAGRLRVPRMLDVDVPTLMQCSEANAGAEAFMCPSPVPERDESTRMWLSYRSSLASFGGLDVLVRTVGNEARLDRGRYVSGAVGDMTASVAALPGSALAQLDIGGNTRLPVTDLAAEIWSTSKNNDVHVPLETVRVEYIDREKPGYRGAWKPVATDYDAANVVPNYSATLRNVGESIAVRAHVTGTEAAVLPAGVEDTARAWCRSQGRVFDGRRRGGPVYVHADLDVGGSPVVEVNARTQDDHTLGASSDAVVDITSWFPLSGSVDAKLALQQAIRSEVDTWLGSIDAGFCIDADVPVHTELEAVTGLTLQQSGAGVRVTLPVMEAMLATAMGRDPVRGTIGEDVVTAEPGNPTRHMAGAWFKTYLAHLDPPPFWMSWDAYEWGGENCDDLAPCNAYVFDSAPPGHDGLWRDVAMHPLAPMPDTISHCSTEDYWRDTCDYPIGRLPILAQGFVNAFGFLPRTGATGGRTDLRDPSQPWRLEFVADVVWSLIATESLGTTTVPGSADTYGERFYEFLRRMSDLDPVGATRPTVSPVTPSTHTYVSEQVICNDPSRLEGAGTESSPRVTLGDGTTVHVWFKDACDETSWFSSPWTRWELRPDVRLVARYPDGSVRWVRPLISYDTASWPYEEMEFFLGPWSSNPPDDRTEGVHVTASPDGTSVQARAYVRGLKGMEWDRTYRFDLSGVGGPVRAGSLLTRDGGGLVTGDPVQEVTAANHATTGVTLSVPLADCRGGCAGRTIYFGDGSSERRDGLEGRPASAVATFNHTWHGAGTYTAMVVTYDSSGRPTDAVPIRVRVT